MIKMGLKLDDPAYDDKVKELNDSKKKEQAEFYRDQIIGLFIFKIFYVQRK